MTDEKSNSAWKSFDWDTMDRLYGKGLISNPRNKNKSVYLSEETKILSKDLFEKHFILKS